MVIDENEKNILQYPKDDFIYSTGIRSSFESPLNEINQTLNLMINCTGILKDTEYRKRYYTELQFFNNHHCLENIIFAYHIKEIISSFNVPFFIRGSAGGSLILFLLGFTTVDPVQHNILFERFMNEHRDTLGDIDFDVPRTLRDKIFKKIWDGFNKIDIDIARICTRVFYQKNSAIRQVLRSIFHFRKTVPKQVLANDYLMEQYFKKNFIATREDVISKANGLIGKLRYSSAHIGGLVILKEGEDYINLNKNNKKVIIPLIDIDKKDVDKQKRFKVDVLSNSGLDLIKMVYPDVTMLDEENFPYEPEVFKMIGRGETIGIFYGESPLSRNTFKAYHQKYGIISIEDIAKCLSIIRPMAVGEKNDLNRPLRKKTKNEKQSLIFDDDWIFELSKLLKISFSDADKSRRQIAKGDLNAIRQLFDKVSPGRLRQLMAIQNYGFCKAHAMNYAQLVYCQAYAKYHKPLEYYTAVLNTLHTGRIYESWVYYLEALKTGIKIFANKKNEKYIYNIKKNTISPKGGMQMRFMKLNASQEIKQFGGLTSLKELESIQGEVACCRKWKGCSFISELEGDEIIDKILN